MLKMLGIRAVLRKYIHRVCARGEKGEYERRELRPAPQC